MPVYFTDIWNDNPEEMLESIENTIEEAFENYRVKAGSDRIAIHDVPTTPPLTEDFRGRYRGKYAKRVALLDDDKTVRFDVDLTGAYDVESVEDSERTLSLTPLTCGEHTLNAYRNFVTELNEVLGQYSDTVEIDDTTQDLYRFSP